LKRLRIALTITLLCLPAAPAFAQNWDFDARRIAMGATGNGDNPAQNLVEQNPSYQSIVLPFGLLQVWNNRHIFDPNAPEYNPVLAM